MIASRTMRWAGHVTRRGTKEVHGWFWWENSRKGDHLVDLGVDGMIIIKWILKKCDVVAWIWIVLAQDRDRWQALLDGVMNLRVP
jgi:hypothetical protein